MRMRPHRSATAIVVLSGCLAIGVAGCSSSSSGSGSSASPTTSGSSSAGVLPPIPITKGGDITAKVGDTLNVTTPNVTKVATNNPTVLDVSQPHSDGSATFNGGAKVVGAGKATLTVYGGITNLEMYSVNVTATN